MSEEPDQQPVAEPAPAPSSTARRISLRSPWLAAGLGAVLVALVWLAAGGPLSDVTPGSSADGSPSPSVVATVCCASQSPLPSPTFTRPTPTPAPTFASYVVKAGDSLSSIARQFETTPRSVAWWNRVAHPTLDPLAEDYNPNHIEPGWTLVLIPGTEFDESTVPGTTPAPSGSAGPTGTPPPASGPPAIVVSHGNRATSQVALTFDMGGRLDPALDILHWLIDNKVHATIFPTGVAGTTTEQGKAALLLARQHPELFTFGNHSWSHPSFTTLTAAEIAEQLSSTERAVVSLTGWTTQPWFRPPFGSWNEGVRSGVGTAGWRYLVMWDVDTIDWKNTADGGPTTSDIVAKVAAQAQGGSIVLMHLGGWHTLEALPGILGALGDKNLQPVTLPELLQP